MTRKKRFFIPIAICFAYIAVFATGISCKKGGEGSIPSGESVAESEVQSPGESGRDETEYVYVIVGATDFFVTTDATKDSVDFSSVTARRENGDGKIYPVETDDSAVIWGKKGVYPVRYVCGSSFVGKQIYIYDITLPEISGATDKTVSSAEEILTGISATDQFGFSLTLSCKINGSENGMLSAGENEAEISASDPVGNTKRVIVKITLKR